MKKYLVVFTLMCAFGWALSVSAEDTVRDNQLQIDSSRLEQERNTDMRQQSSLIKSLFSASDKEVLEAQKEAVLASFQGQQSQLFSEASSNQTAVNQVSDLFKASSETSSYTSATSTYTATASQTSGGSALTAVLYGLACLLLICGASFATYLVNKRED